MIRSEIIAPRLCFYVDEEDRKLYTGHGNQVEICTLDRFSRIESWKIIPNGTNIYGIEGIPCTNYLIVYGEKAISIFNKVTKDNVSCEFKDWVVNVKAYSDHSIIILFGNCIIGIYSIGLDKKLIEEERVNLSIKAIIISGLISGTSWENTSIFVGSAFGPIFYFVPCLSTVSCRVFNGHKGMIFGLAVNDRFLYSISDDRALCVWSLDTCECLFEVFGHYTRPLALEVTNNYIYTGSSDDEICMWMHDSKDLKLVKKISIPSGTIRSLKFVNEHLLVGTQFGALSLVFNLQSYSIQHRAITLEKDKEILMANKIRAFYYISEYNYFWIDNEKRCFMRNSKTDTLIYHLGDVRFNSLAFNRDRSFASLIDNSSIVFLKLKQLEMIPMKEDENKLKLIGLLWIDFNQLIIQTIEGALYLCTIDLSVPVITKKIYLYEIEKGHLITAACKVKSEVYEFLSIGSSKGEMFVTDINLSYPRNNHIEKSPVNGYYKDHDDKPVTDIKKFDHLLYSIGRDGCICCYEIVDKPPFLILLIKQEILEWPKELIYHNSKIIVAGFYGKLFQLVELESKTIVCSIECGGGHRSYQLELNGLLVILTYLQRGRLYCARTQMIEYTKLVKARHYGQIACCGVLMGKILFTGGIDTRLIVSYLDGNDATLVLFSSDEHLSSIHDLDFDQHLLVTCGGRAETICWSVQKEKITTNKFKEDSINLLKKKLVYRFSNDFRIVAVRILNLEYLNRNICTNDERNFYLTSYLLLLACGDGIIRALVVDFTCSKFTQVFQVEPDKLSLVARVEFLDKNSFCAISTNGSFYIYNFILNEIKSADVSLITTLQIEKCGLSALSVITKEIFFAFIGSESGHVVIAGLYPLKIIGNYQYHSSTITGIKAFFNPTYRLCDILTISLDCRLALHKFDLESNLISFDRAIMLNVWDPSSFYCSKIEDRYKVVVVGSGVEIVNI